MQILIIMGLVMGKDIMTTAIATKIAGMGAAAAAEAVGERAVAFEVAEGDGEVLQETMVEGIDTIKENLAVSLRQEDANTAINVTSRTRFSHDPRQADTKAEVTSPRFLRCRITVFYRHSNFIVSHTSTRDLEANVHFFEAFLRLVLDKICGSSKAPYIYLHLANSSI